MTINMSKPHTQSNNISILTMEVVRKLVVLACLCDSFDPPPLPQSSPERSRILAQWVEEQPVANDGQRQRGEIDAEKQSAKRECFLENPESAQDESESRIC